ncbi:MAG: DoxX family membrane protein [Kangiellaceae bacterium]|nr:DoxX family membrane protein [Kangiellaceae bacterium]
MEPTSKNQLTQEQAETIALILRLGLGLVFVIGGWSKLSLLLNESTQAGMVASYLGSAGYVNQLFQDYLFANDRFTPWGFLTILSAFELITGVMFLGGVLIKPLSLFYAFLLWTFVVALPVETVTQIDTEIKTYNSPALFVQVRDVALSGLMLVLFNLGAGKNSLDSKYFNQSLNRDWGSLGLLIRFSIALVFVVAGFFGMYPKIQTFDANLFLLATLSLLLVFSNGRLFRVAAAMAAVIIFGFIMNKIAVDKSLIANLNSFKRELGLLAATIIMSWVGSGSKFTLRDLWHKAKRYFNLEKETCAHLK